MAADGLKVLSFAYKDMQIQELEQLLQKEGGEENKDFRAYIEYNLIYMCTVGIEDPICEESIQSFHEIDKKFGVKIRMLTGDHIETARSVAKKIGMISAD